MDELEQLKGNFLRSLKAAEEQSGLDLSWLKVQYMQLYEAAQPRVQADMSCACPLDEFGMYQMPALPDGTCPTCRKPYR